MQSDPDYPSTSSHGASSRVRNPIAYTPVQGLSEEDDDDGDEDYAERSKYSSNSKRKELTQNGNSDSRQRKKAAREREKEQTRTRKGKAPVRQMVVPALSRPPISGDRPSRGHVAVGGGPGPSVNSSDLHATNGVQGKKKNQKMASVQRNNARREKFNSGMGNSGTLNDAPVERFDADGDVDMDEDNDDSDELSSLPDEYKDEPMQATARSVQYDPEFFRKSADLTLLLPAMSHDAVERNVPVIPGITGIKADV